MDPKKISKKFAKKIAKKLQEAWEDGHDFSAIDAAEKYDEGFRDGLKAEQDRIQKLLEATLQSSLDSLRGPEASFLMKLMKFIEPIELDDSDQKELLNRLFSQSRPPSS
jgi:flagellar biosynthesis/type III secretory pathway protein FliH